MKVEWGSLVSLDYDALLDSGRQIDSSAVRMPFSRLRICPPRQCRRAKGIRHWRDDLTWR